MPLSLQRCLPHTSWPGFIASFWSNLFPYLVEILYHFYSFNGTTIDHQTVVPSFWFRRWRPAFLISSILYNVGILIYCIYTEDIFTILVTIRIVVELYQLGDQV